MNRVPLLKGQQMDARRKNAKGKAIILVCLGILAFLLIAVVPNLFRGNAHFSAQFLQTFDPNALNPTALRQQLESSDVYEVSSVPYPDSEIVFWNLYVPDSAQYDAQLLFREGTELTDGFDYEIQWTRFPGLALRDETDFSPFYAYARQAKVYCHATIASSTCIIQVHTYGDTASKCVTAAEKALLDLFQDLSQYQ